MKYFIFTFIFLSLSCSSNEAKKIEPADIPDMIAHDQTNTKDIIIDVQKDYCPRKGELLCGEKCVNVVISLDHCGQCNNQCIRGRMTCNGTECVCRKGDMCDGDCWDLSSTKHHCGRCDNPCSDSHACVEGECIEISSRREVVSVLAETNEGRSKTQDCGIHGFKAPVGEVQLNDLLMLAAQAHTDDMIQMNKMQHEGSDDSTPFERAKRQNYPGSTIGENVAMGQTDGSEVVAAWIDSDGHCQNLMNGRFDEMGVGYGISPMTGRSFWTQLFGRR